jgi:hypothetical protein
VKNPLFFVRSCVLFSLPQGKKHVAMTWPMTEVCAGKKNPFGGWRDALLLVGPKRPTDYSKFVVWSDGTLLLHARFVLVFTNCPSKKERRVKYILHTTSIIIV